MGEDNEIRNRGPDRSGANSSYIVLYCIIRYYFEEEGIFMQTVSFRIEETKKNRIDLLANLQDRDRSYIINEALDTYLDLMDWQQEHIEEGLRQADAGDFADESEVAAAFDRLKP